MNSTLLKATYDIITSQYVLDARVIPFERAEGKELQQIIFDSVRSAHTWLQHEFPSRLIVTQKQFVSLNDYTEDAYTVTDRLFTVLDEQGGIMCIMEVVIDDDYDTVKEIADIKRESEEMLSENDFTGMTLSSIDDVKSDSSV